MRKSSVATTVVAVTACLTAATALHRRSGRHLPAPALPADSALADREGVVLPFLRPEAAAPAPGLPDAPLRCGDSGGRTKAGASCGARATAGGRCHHHRLAA